MPKDDVEEGLVIATPDKLAAMRAVMPNDGIVEYAKVNIDLVLEHWKAQSDRENELFLAQWLAEHPPEVERSAKPGRQRKPSLSKLIAQAEKSGKTVTSITIEDVTLTFGEPQNSNETNSWDEILKNAPYPHRPS
jgi:hypothetical protein